MQMSSLFFDLLIKIIDGNEIYYDGIDNKWNRYLYNNLDKFYENSTHI